MFLSGRRIVMPLEMKRALDAGGSIAGWAVHTSGQKGQGASVDDDDVDVAGNTSVGVGTPQDGSGQAPSLGDGGAEDAATGVGASHDGGGQAGVGHDAAGDAAMDIDTPQDDGVANHASDLPPRARGAAATGRCARVCASAHSPTLLF